MHVRSRAYRGTMSLGSHHTTNDGLKIADQGIDQAAEKRGFSQRQCLWVTDAKQRRCRFRIILMIGQLKFDANALSVVQRIHDFGQITHKEAK